MSCLVFGYYLYKEKGGPCVNNLEGKHLGKISGLCACVDKATLNGRPYDEIYRGMLAGDNYRYNEMMKRGGILCEFGHPAQQTVDFERTETDPEKACVLITKPLKEGADGKISVDEAIILDTPAGRIFNAIRPFYNFGFSSRGSYEADESSIEGPDGWNQATYVFKGFDIVALPANEESMLSATESVKGAKKKKLKSARETLDINQIADAASVDPDEVSAELDKLFNDDGGIAPAELISVHDFVNEAEQVGVPKEQSNILLDLHKVMVDKATLENQIQKLLFEKAEADASLLSLREQNEQLKIIQQDAESRIESYTKTKEEIQQLVDSLLKTHEGFEKVSDEELMQERTRSQSLAAQVAALKKDVEKYEEETATLSENMDALESAKAQAATAKEEIEKLQKANEQLKTSETTAHSNYKKATENLNEVTARAEKLEKAARLYKQEATSAKEELVSTYATLYSVDPQQLKSKVGDKATVLNIKSAAEGMSKDAVRFSTYGAVPQGVVKRAASAPTIRPRDAIEAELFEGLALDSRMPEENE